MRVVADHREGPDRDLATEFIGHHGQHAGDWLPARGEGCGVGGMGVHNTADPIQLGVDVPGGKGVGGRRSVAVDHDSVEVGDDHVLGGVSLS